jgi:hypothetical protein
MSEESFILDLENKKNAYNAALSEYEQTRISYLELSRKFKIVNNKSISLTNKTNNATSDTKEKCKESCANDLFCAAADFNPSEKTCSTYKTYQESDMMDSSGNFAIVPDTITDEIQKEINNKKGSFDTQNANISAKCVQLIALLSDPKYKTYRDAQSQQNKKLLNDLRERKNLLQQDREFIDGTLATPGFFEDVFNANENVKKSNMTANQNFYIQVVLSVVTVFTIVAAVYYLWPAAPPVPVTSSDPFKVRPTSFFQNPLTTQPTSYLQNPLTTQPTSYLQNPLTRQPASYFQNPLTRQPASNLQNFYRGGSKSLSNQSYFVIGGILLFSIIVSQLHLCTFKTPTSWAVMSGEGDADCAFSMRNGVNL